MSHLPEDYGYEDHSDAPKTKVLVADDGVWQHTQLKESCERRARTIYLCGPINGRTTEDATNWRELVKKLWTQNGGKCLDPMARDYRGRELEPGIAAEIVTGDIEDIQASDAILVFFDKPSVGTAMEVFYAKHVLNKVVVVIDASDKPLSPWLIHHSDSQTKHVGVALATIDMALNKSGK